LCSLLEALKIGEAPELMEERRNLTLAKVLMPFLRESLSSSLLKVEGQTQPMIDGYSLDDDRERDTLPDLVHSCDKAALPSLLELAVQQIAA